MTAEEKWLVQVEERQACYLAVRALFDAVPRGEQHPEVFNSGQRHALASAMEVITARNREDTGNAGSPT